MGLFLHFEIGSLNITLIVLELNVWTTLASSSEISLPLPPQRWIKDMHYQIQPFCGYYYHFTILELDSNLNLKWLSMLPQCMGGKCIYKYFQSKNEVTRRAWKGCAESTGLVTLIFVLCELGFNIRSLRLFKAHSLVARACHTHSVQKILTRL